MTWNYRVVYHRGIYGIKEVYYHEDGSIRNWTVEFVHPFGDNEHELLADLDIMRRAYDLPHLVETSEGLVKESL